MNLQPFIAVFFTIVFFGKFLVVDSKVLAVIIDADEIAFVNSTCKKQNVKIQENTSHETLAEGYNSLKISINAFCNAFFRFEVNTWKSGIIPLESRAYAYYSPSLPESLRARFYPPPQLKL